jgi:MYXO-CTERM domain-containing protein
MQLARFSVTVTAADACSPQVQRDLAWRINFTDAPASCATDDVESETSQWVAEGDESTAVWARVESEPGNHVWRGIDLARPSDSWIMSPDLKVSATGSFGLSFRHRHEFETAQEDRGTVYYDGAVIELTSDGGTTWQDISTYADPGYGGTIDNTSGNPLADRRGYVDHNPSWPETDTVTLDLGSALAGKTVRVRFHIGTDQAAGGAGWELDDIGFTGIDNTPFTRLVDDAGACAVAGPEPPATDAGATGDGGPAPGGGSGRGCSCTTGATGGGGPALLALAALGVVLSARRRRRRWRSPSATSCPPRASAARGSAPSRPSSRACRPSPRRTAPRSSCPRPRP